MQAIKQRTFTLTFYVRSFVETDEPDTYDEAPRTNDELITQITEGLPEEWFDPFGGASWWVQHMAGTFHAEGQVPSSTLAVGVPVTIEATAWFNQNHGVDKDEDALAAVRRSTRRRLFDLPVLGEPGFTNISVKRGRDE